MSSVPNLSEFSSRQVPRYPVAQTLGDQLALEAQRTIQAQNAARNQIDRALGRGVPVTDQLANAVNQARQVNLPKLPKIPPALVPKFPSLPIGGRILPVVGFGLTVVDLGNQLTQLPRGLDQQYRLQAKLALEVLAWTQFAATGTIPAWLRTQPLQSGIRIIQGGNSTGNLQVDTAYGALAWSFITTRPGPIRYVSGPNLGVSGSHWAYAVRLVDGNNSQFDAGRTTLVSTFAPAPDPNLFRVRIYNPSNGPNQIPESENFPAPLEPINYTARPGPGPAPQSRAPSAPGQTGRSPNRPTPAPAADPQRPQPGQGDTDPATGRPRPQPLPTAPAPFPSTQGPEREHDPASPARPQDWRPNPNYNPTQPLTPQPFDPNNPGGDQPSNPGPGNPATIPAPPGPGEVTRQPSPQPVPIPPPQSFPGQQPTPTDYPTTPGTLAPPQPQTPPTFTETPETPPDQSINLCRFQLGPFDLIIALLNRILEILLDDDAGGGAGQVITALNLPFVREINGIRQLSQATLQVVPNSMAGGTTQDFSNTAQWALEEESDFARKAYELLGGGTTFNEANEATLNPEETVREKVQEMAPDGENVGTITVLGIGGLIAAVAGAAYFRQGLQTFPRAVESFNPTTLDPVTSTAGNAVDVTLTTNSTGKAIMTGLKTAQQWISRMAVQLRLDRVFNLLTLVATLHNAAMLSRELGETLLILFDNVLGLTGLAPKDENDNPIPIGNLIGGTIENFIISLVGPDIYNNSVEFFNKANRIYQAAANIVFSLQSIAFSILEALEVVGQWVAWIGNALKRWGVVAERAYAWMNPNPDFSNKFFTRVEQAQELADNFLTITEELRNVQEVASTLGDQKQELEDALKDGLEGDQIENEQQKTKAEDAKVVSESPPISSDDLLRPED